MPQVPKHTNLAKPRQRAPSTACKTNPPAKTAVRNVQPPSVSPVAPPPAQHGATPRNKKPYFPRRRKTNPPAIPPPSSDQRAGDSMVISSALVEFEGNRALGDELDEEDAGVGGAAGSWGASGGG